MRAKRMVAAAFVALGLSLLLLSITDCVARASLGGLSFSVSTTPAGGTVDFGAIDPEVPATRSSAVTFRVSSDLTWRVSAAASPLPGTCVLEQAPYEAGSWTAIGTAPTVLKDTQAACALTDFVEDLRLTAGWDLDPGTYSVTITYQAEFADKTAPVPVSLAINGGAAYANAATWSPATLDPLRPGGDRGWHPRGGYPADP